MACRTRALCPTLHLAYASGSPHPQDLSTESSDGLPLNQALSPNQKKAVGFRAANSTHSISRDGGHDDVDDDDEDGGSGSSGGGGGGALQRRRCATGASFALRSAGGSRQA